MLLITLIFEKNIYFSVSQFAMKTGDYKSLSAVDLKVMALTYQLEKEFVGSDHIKSAPERKVCDHGNT